MTVTQENYSDINSENQQNNAFYYGIIILKAYNPFLYTFTVIFK